jgi:endonuclease III
VARLVAHGCTPAAVAATEEAVLAALITPAGFANNKVGSCCCILRPMLKLPACSAWNWH